MALMPFDEEERLLSMAHILEPLSEEELEKPPRRNADAHLEAGEIFFTRYFALVMATGSVSLAAHLLGMERIAQVLFWINIAAYIVLWTITLVRLFRYHAQFFYDLTHHDRGVTFLSTVAATCVLGTQFAVLTPYKPLAVSLWFVGIALWMALIYTFFVAVTVRESKPTLEAGISGSWLLVVVSTESICVL